MVEEQQELLHPQEQLLQMIVIWIFVSSIPTKGEYRKVYDTTLALYVERGNFQIPFPDTNIGWWNQNSNIWQETEIELGSSLVKAQIFLMI